MKKEFPEYEYWLEGWKSENRKTDEWRKKHALVFKESQSYPDDPDLVELRNRPEPEFDHRDVVLVMAEVRVKVKHDG